MSNLLCLSDLGAEGIVTLLNAADRFREQRGSKDARQPLKGKSIALVFEKASTRTRLSLEVAVNELGAHPVVLTSAGSQLGRGEPVEDTARVLGRMVHGITLRTFAHETVETLARYSRLPVLNALTDSGHPMQILADLQTTRREFGKLKGLKYAWVGDGNNVAMSWIEAAGLLGLELALACPSGYTPPTELVEKANQLGGKVTVHQEPHQACQQAHVINTDVFTSMGQEEESEARLRAFEGMCVTEELVALAAEDCIILHCLPAHRGEEITESVLEGSRSRVWDQAESRLHTSKAALCWALDAL